MQARARRPGSRRSITAARCGGRRLVSPRSSSTSSPALTAHGRGRPCWRRPYAQGHLDWYAFDVDTAAGSELDPGDTVPAAGAEARLRSFIPAPISLRWMPNPRYWELENRRTEFADINADTIDVAKLLLIEFALVYSNDWCVIPPSSPGSLCEVLGLMVTDDFGERSWCRAAGRGIDDQWQRWSMFTLSHQRPGRTRACSCRLRSRSRGWRPRGEGVLPARRDGQHGLGRRAHRPVGRWVPGSTATTPRDRRGTPAAPRSATSHSGEGAYVLGTDVPENWFPFVPVHMAGSTRWSNYSGRGCRGENRPIRGAVLNPGPKAYFLNEEEVPRAGRLVTRSYQRTRSFDGSTVRLAGQAIRNRSG